MPPPRKRHPSNRSAPLAKWAQLSAGPLAASRLFFSASSHFSSSTVAGDKTSTEDSAADRAYCVIAARSFHSMIRIIHNRPFLPRELLQSPSLPCSLSADSRTRPESTPIRLWQPQTRTSPSTDCTCEMRTPLPITPSQIQSAVR